MGKVIFFDVDGTIWDEKMVIPASTKKAFEKLHKTGHLLIMCTGRARASIRSRELLDMDFDGIIAACGTYIEMDGEAVFEKNIAPGDITEIIDVLKKYRMPLVLEGSGDYWIDEFGFENDPYVDYLYADMGDHAHVLKGYSPAMHINKFSADILADTDFESIKRLLAPKYFIMEHVDNVVEFVPIGFSKASGIHWLCNYLGVDVADTFAIGDSVNDLEMFQAAGTAIVMGDALEKVKKYGDYVTDGIWEDGLYKAMEHFGLI